ncbi:hypothetical protein FOZ60_013532 [Perkinsus olseni]|uniref:Uncharacterized protein n=1 Tax=Perkinsus olseni TaxID=32597 RepID=A0A7J6P8K8_PEROL|nr:hypothetical protein FOZ60_013532 [Perkinsus olseni]
MIHPGLRVSTPSNHSRKGNRTAATTAAGSRGSFGDSPYTTTLTELSLEDYSRGHGALPTASQHQQRRSVKRPETRRLDRRPSRSFRALRSRHKSPYLALPWMPAGVLTTDDVSSSVLEQLHQRQRQRRDVPPSAAAKIGGPPSARVYSARLVLATTNQLRSWTVWDATIVDNNRKGSEAQGEVVAEEAEEADAATRLTVLEQFALLRLAEKRSREVSGPWWTPGPGECART